MLLLRPRLPRAKGIDQVGYYLIEGKLQGTDFLADLPVCKYLSIPAVIFLPSAAAQAINEAMSSSPLIPLFRSVFSVSMHRVRRLGKAPLLARPNVGPA
jgi:hypothetical protein